MLGVLDIAGDPARDLPVGTPGQRPCGLPSHLVRLNGAGHTGHPCPGWPQMDVVSICPLTIQMIGASKGVPTGKSSSGWYQNERRIKLQRGVGMLPPGP